MSINRSVPAKVGDWLTAYNAIREEITPPAMRVMLSHLSIPENASPEPGDYVKVVQASIALARLVCANDRAASVVAAMLTQSGVSRPTVEVNDDID